MGKWEKRSSSLLGGGMCLVPHLPAPQPVGMTLPQTPSNPWPSEVADTLHSEASYCPWATTTQDGLSKHRGGHQGWSGGVLIARSRPRCPSRSCTPGVPNRIYWHRKQFLGPPPFWARALPMGCFPLHNPPSPCFVYPFNSHKPCCAQHIGGSPLHSQPPALAAFSRLRSISPQSNEGVPLPGPSVLC